MSIVNATRYYNDLFRNVHYKREIITIFFNWKVLISIKIQGVNTSHNKQSQIQFYYSSTIILHRHHFLFILLLLTVLFKYLIITCQMTKLNSF